MAAGAGVFEDGTPYLAERGPVDVPLERLALVDGVSLATGPEGWVVVGLHLESGWVQFISRADLWRLLAQLIEESC